MTFFNDLLDSGKLHSPVSLGDEDIDVLKDDLKQMYVIRRAEELIAENIVSGNISCPCHLGIGQEAIAVGLSRYLKNTDRVFGGHRSHTHFLGLRGSVYQLFAETLGKHDGCSKGMGGSMHLFDPSIGFGGSVPIVGASVPIAVGAALGSKMDGGNSIAVSYLGDSACEEGGVQEAFNLAAVMKLPVIFIVENNLFASHMHINFRQPLNFTARFAEAHNIPSRIIDGNNIIDVYNAANEAVTHCRNANGPFFIEAITYRWRGHVGPSEDTDVGVKRKDDLSKWKMRDPIKRLKEALMGRDLFSDRDFSNMTNQVDQELAEFWEKAMNAPYPSLSFLTEIVYKK